jgi:NDP-sugar pyrophosphorylase family protein
MLEKSKKTKASLVLASQETQMPWKYGMLQLKGDRALKIVEKPEKGKEPSKMKAQSIYLLPKEILKYLSRVQERQYSFEDALQLYMDEKDVRVVEVKADTASVKYPWDVLDAVKKIQDRFLQAKTAKSAKVSKKAVIEGKVFIGENAKVFENAVIKGPCFIGANCVVGNNALVREHSCLEEGAAIGTNTEVKNSYLGKGAHVHSGFIGDSVIGAECRIGAGFVTANRRLDRANVKSVVKGESVDSGLSFLGAIIGNKVKIGIHASTMPGVIIGNGSVIGADTQVAKNVPSNVRYYTKFQEFVEEKG